MASTKIPQSRIDGLLDSLNELNSLKANVVDLSHVPAGLTHSISGKKLVVAPGHVLNNAGKEVLITTENTTQEISTVTAGLSSGIILGDTAERIDILDYSSLSSGFSSTGRIISVDSLGDYTGFASGTVNSSAEGLDDAIAMFYEGTATSKQAGFLFDNQMEIGEYVITLASDTNISDARIAFYSLASSTDSEDGSTNYELTLVSQAVVSAPAAATEVSLTAIVDAPFQMIAVSTNIDSSRYCRMYKVAVAATYNTYLCKYGQGYVIRMALSDEAISSANYLNFAKIGNVTIGNGPVACYPEKDLASAYADGDLRQQEPSYSNFYTRKEMDEFIDEIDRTKADRADTLAEYGIKDAYTKDQANALLDGKQDALTPGQNIDISVNEETGKLEISTTFDETYSKAQVDELFAKKSTTLEGYGITDAYTKTESLNLINAKQDSTDETLTTESKSIVGAINEVHASLADSGAITIERLI